MVTNYGLTHRDSWVYNSPSLCSNFSGKVDQKLINFQIFVIRAVFGLAISVVLTKMFYGSIALVYVAGLAAILVGLAYFSEFLRNRKNR